jgi:acyl dehydratase
MRGTIEHVALTALLAIGLVSPAVAQQVTPIPNVASLAGRWAGVVRAGDTAPAPYMAVVNMVVDQDGTYKATGPRGGTVEGRITVASDGSAMYQSSANQGSATLYSDGTLRFVAQTGTVIWERTK